METVHSLGTSNITRNYDFEFSHIISVERIDIEIPIKESFSGDKKKFELSKIRSTLGPNYRSITVNFFQICSSVMLSWVERIL